MLSRKTRRLRAMWHVYSWSELRMVEDGEWRDHTRQHGVTAVTENQLQCILSVSHCCRVIGALWVNPGTERTGLSKWDVLLVFRSELGAGDISKGAYVAPWASVWRGEDDAMQTGTWWVWMSERLCAAATRPSYVNLHHGRWPAPTTEQSCVYDVTMWGTVRSWAPACWLLILYSIQ